MVRPPMLFSPKLRRIHGVEVPRRRFTAAAAVYFLIFVCVPVLGIALALDILLYLLFDRVFGMCYAVLCLLV